MRRQDTDGIRRGRGRCIARRCRSLRRLRSGLRGRRLASLSPMTRRVRPRRARGWSRVLGLARVRQQRRRDSKTDQDGRRTARSRSTRTTSTSTSTTIKATPGPLTVTLTNKGAIEHTFKIDGTDLRAQGERRQRAGDRHRHPRARAPTTSSARSPGTPRRA